MRSYQLVLYANDGAVRHLSVECLDDKHALTIARVFAVDHRVDIFCDVRRVAVLGEPPPRYGASANAAGGKQAGRERPSPWAALWAGIVKAVKRSD